MTDSMTQAYKLWIHANQELLDAERKLGELPHTASASNVQGCEEEVARLRKHSDNLLVIATRASLNYHKPAANAP